MSGSLATILPVHVFAAACDPACVEPDDVHPAERDAVGPRVVDRRRREFAAGRRCTRLALSQLHPALGDVGIPIGPDRAPLWPPGVVGSITHCAGYCAAVVARRDRFAGLGLDAEPNAALPDGVEALVCTSAEPAWLRTPPPDDGVHWPTLVFSAKEALYKAWAPLTGRWLGFEDAELDIDTRASSFEARILLDAPPVTAAGRFVVADGRCCASHCSTAPDLLAYFAPCHSPRTARSSSSGRPRNTPPRWASGSRLPSSTRGPT